MRGGRQPKPGEVPPMRRRDPDANRRRGRRFAAMSSSARAARSRAGLGTHPGNRGSRSPGTTPSSASSHSGPRSGRRRPRESRANEITLASGSSRRGVLRSPLQRSNLDPAIGGVRNVDAVQLNGTDARGRGEGRDGGFRPGHGQGRGESQWRARGQEHSRAAPSRRLSRGIGPIQRCPQVTDSDRLERRPPQWQGAFGDLLERDHVRVAAGERGGLLGQTRTAPSHVPADDAH